MLAAQKARSQTQIDIFVVEQDKTRYDRLNAVGNEYRGRGIAILIGQGIQVHRRRPGD